VTLLCNAVVHPPVFRRAPFMDRCADLRAVLCSDVPGRDRGLVGSRRWLCTIAGTLAV